MHKDKINKLHGSLGMTLVEIMMVMAIMSIVMLAVISLYVPAQQSMVAQTQVSDVQSNLRLALNRMTKDLLTAGFLVTNDPIVFSDYDPADAGNPGTEDTGEFIIRTRAVGNAFARVESAVDVGSNIRLTVFETEMAALFPDGSKVRLFEPVTATQVVAAAPFAVVSTAGNTIVIDPGASGLTAADVNQENVLVGIRDGAPVTQTIRYRLNNGALERIVNGNRQFLARNMDSVAFAYDYTSQGRVRRVDIVLTGVTQALKDDAISGAKSRQVATSVSLRNVN
jgi:prepilin-type N-terminal cleavage/methylation domain-containing protein